MRGWPYVVVWARVQSQFLVSLCISGQVCTSMLCTNMLESSLSLFYMQGKSRAQSWCQLSPVMIRDIFWQTAYYDIVYMLAYFPVLFRVGYDVWGIDRKGMSSRVEWYQYWGIFPKNENRPTSLYSVCHSFNQSVCLPVSQTVSLLLNQSVSLSIMPSIKYSVYQSVFQSISQSLSQSIMKL